MKLKQIIVPAVASLLVLAACGGTTSSSEGVSSEASSSLVDSEEAEAAELALRQLPYGTQSNPGMQDRTFDVLTSVSAKGYTFKLNTKVEEVTPYEGSSVTLTTVTPKNRVVGVNKYTDGETQKEFTGAFAFNGKYSTVSFTTATNIDKDGYYGLMFFETEPEALNSDKTNIDYGVVPVTGKTYKFGAYHGGTGEYLYSLGDVDGNYGASTKSWAEATEFQVEAMDDGGYAIKIVSKGHKNEGKYISLVRSSDNKYTNVIYDATEPFSFSITQDPSKTTAVVKAGGKNPDAPNAYALWKITAEAIGSAGTVLATSSWNIRIDPATVYTIAQIFSEGVKSGDVFYTYGYVVGSYANDSRYVWIRDGNNGMTIYGTSLKNYKLEAGDLVRINGEYSPYSGLPEIKPNSVEIIDADYDAYAAAVVNSKDPIDLNGMKVSDLTSANISVPVTVDAKISSVDFGWNTKAEDLAKYPDGERKYTIDLTFGDGQTIEVHGEEDKDGKALLDAVFTTDKSSGKNVAVSDLTVGTEVTVSGILGYYKGYQIINAAFTPKASA